MHWYEAYERADKVRVFAIVQMGAELSAAKADIKHGEWQTMVHRLPLGGTDASKERTAQYLMSIHGNATLANPNHGSLLPPHEGTLRELAPIAAPKLAKAITDGKVTPDMQRKDAIALRHEIEGTSRKASDNGTDLAQKIARRLDGLVELIGETPDDATRLAFQQYAAKVDELRAAPDRVLALKDGQPPKRRTVKRRTMERRAPGTSP